jgi:hypothetical protein
MKFRESKIVFIKNHNTEEVTTFGGIRTLVWLIDREDNQKLLGVYLSWPEDRILSNINYFKKEYPKWKTKTLLAHPFFRNYLK